LVKTLIPVIFGAGVGFCWAWDRYVILNRDHFRNLLRIGVRSRRPIMIRELLSRLRYAAPWALAGGCIAAIIWRLSS
jgi:hypothetical protein